VLVLLLLLLLVVVVVVLVLNLEDSVESVDEILNGNLGFSGPGSSAMMDALGTFRKRVLEF
jgi:hypothetical protein